jgi:glycosyltransferase involved in cell wall biosynthesis
MMKKHILVDGRTFSLQDKGGVSQMWAHLLGTDKWHDEQRTTLFLYPGFEKNIHLKDALAKKGDCIKIIKSPIPPSDNSNHASEASKNIRVAELRKYLEDLPECVVNTYYGENIFPEQSSYVVVAHDYAHEEVKLISEKPTTKAVINRKKESFKSAKMVVSVSNNTRKTGLKYYDALNNTENIVIYHGHAGNVIHGAKVKNQIVHMGTRGGYKNFDVVLIAIEKFLNAKPYAKFLVVGGEAPDASIFNLIKKFPGRILVKSGISDDAVDQIMAFSSVFISASLYEGFGIPVLNALRLGTIPVLSNIPIYKEIGGRDAIFFDPQCPDKLLDSLFVAVDSKKQPKNYFRTWERVAEDYVSAFKKL